MAATLPKCTNLVVLPARVTFRSEYLDSKYLSAYKYFYDDTPFFVNREDCNRFASGLQFDDPLVAYQLFPTHQGYYRIKSLYFGKFLRRDFTNWIFVDAEDNDDGPDTLFECIQIRENVIALRNMGNKEFCGGFTRGGRIDILNARYSTPTKETRLIIEERVVRRDISNLEYRLPESRVHDGQVIALAHQTIQNRSHGEVEHVISFSESIETSTFWDNTTSIKIGVSTEFNVKAIPFIDIGGKVNLSLDVTERFRFGSSHTTTTKIETSTKVSVPPLTKMKVSFLCTKATCHVPFSYTQTDLLPEGDTVSVVKQDGIFTGVNAYDFNIKIEEVVESGQQLKLHKVEPASMTFK